MKACSTDAKVQQYGCWAIANIVWSETTIKMLGRKLGIEKLMKDVISRFSHRKDVIEKAELALLKLKDPLK